MKKYVNKLKRIVAVMLSVAMVVSLFQWDLLRTYADGETTEAVKNFVTDEGQIVSKDYYKPVADEPLATINANNVIVYDYHEDGAKFLELKDVKDTEIYLSQKIVYENGTVLYRYSTVENSGTVYEAQLKGYEFILAKNLTLAGEEPEASATPAPTPSATPDAIVDKTLSDKTGVSVKGKLPETVTLTVEAVATEKLGIDTTTYGIGDNSLFFDVTLVNKGADYQPENGVTVVFPEDKIPFATGVTYYAYHIHDDGIVDKIGPYVYDGGSISVDFSGLSYVGLAEDEVLLERVPQNEEPELIDIENIKAKINVTPLEVYGDIAYGEYGVVVEGMVGTEVVLRQSATYSDGTVMYRYDYNYTTADALSEVATSYPFIHEDDIIIDKDEVETTEQTLTDTTTGITVSGALPQGTTLSITEVSPESTGLDTTVYPVGVHSMVYDISLTYNDKEYQPEGEVSVKIPEVEIPFDFNSGYMLYHITENGEVEVKGPYVYTGGFINRYVEHFSYFVFTDVFEEAEITYEKQGFKDNDVVIYEAPFEGTTTYTINNGLDHVIYAEFIFTDGNGVTWYKFFNDTFSELDEDYYFVKSTELALRDKYTGVLVSGDIPDDVTLSVTEKTIEETGLNTDIYDLGGNSRFFDVTLTQNDVEYQPENGVTVVVPESNINLDRGSSYLVYHIHGDVVDLQGPFIYEGGDMNLQFDNLSIVGYSESTDPINLTEKYGTATVTSVNPEISETLVDEVTLYDGYETSVYTANLTGVAGQPILIYEKVTFSNSDIVLYHYYYAGDESGTSDMCVIMQKYGFISSEYIAVEEELPDVPVLEDSVVADETTGIKVYGYLPVGIKLNVIKKSVADITLDTTTYPLGTNSIVYDISLTYKGVEYQPESEVSIKLPESEIPFEFNSGYVMYHIHGEGDTATVEIDGPHVYTDGFINRHVDSFSTFVFTDIYPDAEIAYRKASFKSNDLTVYENASSTATTYAINNALDHVIYVEFVFTDSNDITWYKFYNDTFDTLEEKYYFVKAEDMSYAFDVSAYPAIPVETTAETDTMPYSTMLYNTRNLLIASETQPTDTNNDGLVIDKKVTPNDGGTYTVTLQAWVTGNVKVTRSSLPTDIVLVLDQSGSMDDAMGGEGYFVAQGTASSIYTGYASKNLLFKPVNNEYTLVTVTPVGDVTYSYSHYTYKSGGGHGGGQTVNGLRNMAAFEAYSDNIYYLLDGEYYQVFVSRTSRDGTYTYTYERDVDNDGDLDTVPIGTSTGENGVLEQSSQFYSRRENTAYTSYIYSYTDADGTTVTETYTTDQDITSEGYVYYGEDTRSRLEVLQEAVQSFVEAVATDAKGVDNTLGTGDDVAHRIAVVGFGRGNYSDKYYNTEVFVGTTEYEYNSGDGNANTSDAAQQHYDDAMQEMFTATGVATIRSTVGYDANGDGDYNDAGETAGVLDGSGGTYVDLGIEMANGILEAEKGYKASETETQRNKVVIVFTDGAPGYDGDWEGNNYDTEGGNAGAVADVAVNNARITKNTYGAKVYTIGILGGADHDEFTINTTSKSVTLNYATYDDDNNSTTNANANANRYMHYLSSNYTPEATATTASMTSPGKETFPRDTDGVPTGDSYYLAASDSAGLNSIFQKLSESISGTSNSTLDSTTQIKDIVSTYFTLPDGAGTNITVKTEDALYTGGVLSWENPQNLAATVTINGKTVDVSGFDFKANYVASTARKESESSTTTDFYGRKLVISFPIEVEEYYIGGNFTETNGSTSGVYKKVVAEDGTVSYEKVDYFEEPTVDIPVKDIIATPHDQHIYRTNSIDLRTQMLFTDVYVFDTAEGETEDTVNKQINGINNANADITFTIKDGDNVVGVYFIPAGSSFVNGVWSAMIDDVLTPIADIVDATVKAQYEAKLTPILDSDKTYTIEWLVDGTNDNGIEPAETENISTGSTAATVYVYNPVLTFKDSVAYLGDASYPTIDDENNLVSTVWKHTTDGEVDAETDAEGNIIKDNKNTGLQMSGSKPKLNITYNAPTGSVSQFGNVEVNVTKVSREDDKSIDIPATYVHQSCTGKTCTLTNGAELFIHVYSPTLTLKDSNVYYGGSIPLNYDKNIVTNSVVWSNATLGNDASGKAPEITVTGTPNITGDIVNTTEDISITAVITRVDNGNNITAGTTINHQDCVNNEDEYNADILLHVFVPSYTFADANVHLGATVPDTDVLNNTTVENGWVKANANAVSADNYANSAPKKLELIYKTDKSGIISNTDDIKVNLMVEADGNDITSVTVFDHKECGNEGCAWIDQTQLSDPEFLLHVKVPTYTFKDLNAYLGEKVTSELDSGFVSQAWPSGDYLTKEPFITLEYAANPVSGTVIKYTADIPVNVTAKVGDTALTGCIVHHQDCNSTTGILGSTAETSTATWPYYSTGDIAEFVVHIKTVSLNVSKVVLDSDDNPLKNDETEFEITIAISGDFIPESLNYKVNDVAKSTEVSKDGIATIKLTHAQTAVFEDLPVGTYTVTEADYSDSYQTTVDGENGREREIILSSTTPQGTVAFVNKLTIADLKIEKVAGAGTSFESGETFVFKVKDSKGDLVTEVVIAGAGSITIKDLPIDTYTVSEDISWSYRYNLTKIEVNNQKVTDSTSAVVTLNASGGKVTFTNTVKEDDKWLKADAYDENTFSAVTSTNN